MLENILRLGKLIALCLMLVTSAATNLSSANPASAVAEGIVACSEA